MTEAGGQDAAFIGRVTAGATHELRNVLAIVKESAGLMEDLLDLGSRRGELDTGRLRQAVSRIDAQVARGAELLGALNRFAHAMDREEEGLDLCRQVEQMALLARRFVRRRERELRVREGPDGVVVQANGLAVHRSLVSAVECCAEQVPEGGVVVVGVERVSGRPAVRVSGEAADGTVVPVSGAGCEAGRVGGLEVSSDPSGAGFLLVVPVGRV
jgi:C4-dicarboxylate-specific signal transduction histidine kinase